MTFEWTPPQPDEFSSICVSLLSRLQKRSTCSDLPARGKSHKHTLEDQRSGKVLRRRGILGAQALVQSRRKDYIGTRSLGAKGSLKIEEQSRPEEGCAWEIIGHAV